MDVASPDTRPQIFISHASGDKNAVDPLVDLLLELGAGRLIVFSSSSPGYDIPTGAEFFTYIKNALSQSELVVHFITPAFLKSDFCMLELGASWVQGKAFPILAPPLTADGVRGTALASLQLPTLTSGDGLDKLKDRVGKLVGVTTPTAGWVERRGRTLSYMQGALDRASSRQINRLAAVGVRGQRLNIWALRGDDVISHSWWTRDDGKGWKDPYNFEAPSNTVDIAVTSRGPGQAEVFVVDNVGQLWHRWWGEWGWSEEWRKFADDVAPPLTACSYQDDHIEIFAVRKSNGSIIHWWSWESPTWSDSGPLEIGLQNVSPGGRRQS